MSNFDDVCEFQEKFNMLRGHHPRQLTTERLRERIEFLWEEFSEFVAGCGYLATAPGGHPTEISGKLKLTPNGKVDIAEQADALIDLVYVAMGTAAMMGLPWQELWDDVQRANMSKERGITHRGHSMDCVKPAGWVGPKTMEILLAYGYDPKAKEVGQ